MKAIKSIIAVAAIALAMSFTSCGGGDKAGGSSDSTKAALNKDFAAVELTDAEIGAMDIAALEQIGQQVEKQLNELQEELMKSGTQPTEDQMSKGTMLAKNLDKIKAKYRELQDAQMKDQKMDEKESEDYGSYGSADNYEGYGEPTMPTDEPAMAEEEDF